MVHAGVYYAPGSLKATLCTQGRELLREACGRWDLPYDECGKLIVARRSSEIPRLRTLQQRAAANGVPGMRWLEGDAITEVEPHVAGVAALHSPVTAIVEFVRLAQALSADIERRGGKLLLGTEVTGFRHGMADVDVLTSTGRVPADVAILCAGLQSDRVARLAGDVADPAIVPFRGEYYRLVAGRQELVRGLVYPVPDPRYPFLGVHFTRRVDGNVDVGPNAVLALGREAYRRGDVNWGDVYGLVSGVGFRRMARRHWRAGLREMKTSLSKKAFVAAASSYIPSLTAGDLVPAPAGVRAQAVAASGDLVDDFELHFLGPVVAVRNAPSPAGHLVARHCPLPGPRLGREGLLGAGPQKGARPADHLS